MEARDQLLDYIQSPATRSSLHAYVRRRGLSDSADDLVQSVLCDALAVEAVPADSTELPRWLTGIARNKVVDEHRRRARWKRAELPDELEAPSTGDARDLLRRIEREVQEPEERRALSWLVREHAGDPLYVIAMDQALAPDTLRQRICRLRKSLRARYLAPLALLLALGSGWAAFDHAVGPAPAAASASLLPYAGAWRVTASSPARYAQLGLSVRIEGNRVLLSGPAELVVRELSIEQLSGDQVRLRAGDKVWLARLEQLGPEQIRLSSARGSVVLSR